MRPVEMPGRSPAGRARAVTIVDVAKAAGVSPATISRVLTGSSVPVAERTRLAVQEAAARLGYRPNANARQLVLGRSTALGVVTQHPASPYFGEILAGVDDHLRGGDYHAIYASGNWDLELEEEALDLLLRHRVDGLILLGGLASTERLEELARTTPLIVVARQFAGHPERELLVDNRKGARVATEHLLALGHRRIAYMRGTLGQPDTLERELGFRDAMAAAGLPVDERLVLDAGFLRQKGLDATERLVASGVPFTAIFCANDDAASGAQLALQRHGLTVPDDVSLVGFDDTPEAEFRVPPLTTVRQPTLDLGRAAARGLIRLIAGEPPDLPIIEAELVVRESTAPPRN
jgi:LacI family transcriptional regulator